MHFLRFYSASPFGSNNISPSDVLNKDYYRLSVSEYDYFYVVHFNGYYSIKEVMSLLTVSAYNDF